MDYPLARARYYEQLDGRDVFIEIDITINDGCATRIIYYDRRSIRRENADRHTDHRDNFRAKRLHGARVVRRLLRIYETTSEIPTPS